MTQMEKKNILTQEAKQEVKQEATQEVTQEAKSEDERTKARNALVRLLDSLTNLHIDAVRIEGKEKGVYTPAKYAIGNSSFDLKDTPCISINIKSGKASNVYVNLALKRLSEGKEIAFANRFLSVWYERELLALRKVDKIIVDAEAESALYEKHLIDYIGEFGMEKLEVLKKRIESVKPAMQARVMNNVPAFIRAFALSVRKESEDNFPQAFQDAFKPIRAELERLEGLKPSLKEGEHIDLRNLRELLKPFYGLTWAKVDGVTEDFRADNCAYRVVKDIWQVSYDGRTIETHGKERGSVKSAMASNGKIMAEVILARLEDMQKPEAK